MNNRRGEVTTLVAIGAVILLGIGTVVSSSLINKNQVKTPGAKAAPACSDNPETPPTGYTWHAMCDQSYQCDDNSDSAQRAFRTKNNLSATAPVWCYGFSGPNSSAADWRWMILEKGNAGAPKPPAKPDNPGNGNNNDNNDNNPPPPPPADNGNGGKQGDTSAKPVDGGKCDPKGTLYSCRPSCLTCDPNTSKWYLNYSESRCVSGDKDPFRPCYCFDHKGQTFADQGKYWKCSADGLTFTEVKTPDDTDNTTNCRVQVSVNVPAGMPKNGVQVYIYDGKIDPNSGGTPIDKTATDDSGVATSNKVFDKGTTLTVATFNENVYVSADNRLYAYTTKTLNPPSSCSAGTLTLYKKNSSSAPPAGSIKVGDVCTSGSKPTKVGTQCLVCTQTGQNTTWQSNPTACAAAPPADKNPNNCTQYDGHDICNQQPGCAYCARAISCMPIDQHANDCSTPPRTDNSVCSSWHKDKQLCTIGGCRYCTGTSRCIGAESDCPPLTSGATKTLKIQNLSKIRLNVFSFCLKWVGNTSCYGSGTPGKIIPGGETATFTEMSANINSLCANNPQTDSFTIAALAQRVTILGLPLDSLTRSAIESQKVKCSSNQTDIIIQVI